MNYYPMNGVLNSEAKFQLLEHSYTEHNCLEVQDNFSDLVPFFVTVESVLNTGYYSLDQLNPMTASNYSDNAAVQHSFSESFYQKTGLNMLGTGSSCTSTVAFFN